MINKVADRNYFLDKLKKDKEINSILENLTIEEKKEALKDIEEIRNILHLKNKVDNQIIKEYDMHIIVPTGTEETLIRELNIFNKQMYDDYPTYYTLDFDDILNENKNKDNNLKTIIKPQQPKTKTYSKNILKLSNPVIEDSTEEFELPNSIIENEQSIKKIEDIELPKSILSESNDEEVVNENKVLENKEINDFLKNDSIESLKTEKSEKLVKKEINEFEEFENKLLNNPIKIKVEHFDNLLVDYKTEGKEILEKQKDLLVSTEQQKQDVISAIKQTLEDGNYHKLNLKKTFSLSYSKYMNRLKHLKKNFIQTYGSEIFTRIKNVVQEENALYENIDRSNKIRNLKKRKEKKKKNIF
ncbi:hypothetical protein SLITO_v1c04800 [Spiroplasma litorale]|uniref:Uncharacterized protein n=1 Tax=Spiroplasma litorale TaxID=216942 RepID=A0A0K1W1S4_9MOLU|nr:hypothetical protein [Spiroplasma litorale]AKX34133.1 hypothetical protein SLITO_v1c04800 [Spiroplasma litorale]